MNDKLIELLYNQIRELLFFQMIKELERQGHTLTGNLVQSFDTVLKESLSIEFIMQDYGLSLNYGIQPQNIPFTPVPPFRGGTSKYIQGLIRWVRLRGIATGEKAKSVAFAIATKHKKHGYPLGKKIGFFNIALDNSEEQIIKYIQNYVESTIMILVSEYIENTITNG